MFDLLIKNGKIVDGTGSPWFYSDIAIKGNQIIEIKKFNSIEAKKVIDAAGKVITPGFIDMHTHSDLVILEEGIIEAKVQQGITTDLLGQDGIAAAPLPKKYLEPWKRNLAGLDGTPDISWNWTTLKEYLDQIHSVKPSYNLAVLAPHGNIRMEAIGLDNRPANDNEIEEMQNILKRSLDEGAVGMSTGLIYPPCSFAELKELHALCEILGEYGAPLVIHQRSEGDEILESMQDLLSIMRLTDCHLHLSHLKNCGKENWYKTESVLALIDRSREEGIEVTFDQYPYTAGSTMLSAILPPWAHGGGTEEMLRKLEDTSQRELMKKDMKEGIKGWDSMSNWAGWDGIIITSVESEKNQSLVGKTIKEIVDTSPEEDYAEFALKLILEENNGVGMIDFVMDEPSVKKILSHPAGTVGSDGLLGGEPHPRAYGTFPKILGRYVREEKITSFEEMIRRMTSQPARIIGVQNRGILREGLIADLVILDEEEIIDTATYDNPRSYPEGIDYVIVGGKIIVDHGKAIKTHGGEVITRNYI